MTLSVRHPRLPFGVVWVPMFSFVVYLAACGTRLLVRLAPRAKLADKFPMDTARVGWLVTRTAEVLLWSGGYTLVEVVVPREQLSLRIRVV